MALFFGARRSRGMAQPGKKMRQAQRVAIAATGRRDSKLPVSEATLDAAQIRRLGATAGSRATIAAFDSPGVVGIR